MTWLSQKTLKSFIKRCWRCSLKSIKILFQFPNNYKKRLKKWWAPWITTLLKKVIKGPKYGYAWWILVVKWRNRFHTIFNCTILRDQVANHFSQWTKVQALTSNGFHLYFKNTVFMYFTLFYNYKLLQFLTTPICTVFIAPCP